jgi:hypothetical protein
MLVRNECILYTRDNTLERVFILYLNISRFSNYSTGKPVLSQPVKLISNPAVAMLYLLYSHAGVPEMALCAFPPRTDDINTLFEKGIKRLLRIAFVGLPVSSNEGFQLSKELLNRI